MGAGFAAIYQVKASGLAYGAPANSTGSNPATLETLSSSAHRPRPWVKGADALNVGGF
jgi:hypothetical protein